MNEILDIEQLEEEIALLVQKRAEMIYQQYGIEERYFVYDTKNEKVDSSAWVLSSRSETDKKVLEDISDKKYYSPEWNEYIKSWLTQQELVENPVVVTGEEDI